MEFLLSCPRQWHQPPKHLTQCLGEFLHSGWWNNNKALYRKEANICFWPAFSTVYTSCRNSKMSLKEARGWFGKPPGVQSREMGDQSWHCPRLLVQKGSWAQVSFLFVKEHQIIIALRLVLFYFVFLSFKSVRRAFSLNTMQQTIILHIYWVALVRHGDVAVKQERFWSVLLGHMINKKADNYILW